MKKSVLALAVLGAFAGAASAQSSVTLFGVVDLNFLSVSNDERTYSMGTNGMSSSQLGFRGVEDLGGGLKASFWLEMGIAPDTGAGSAAWGNSASLNNNRLFFDRRSTLSLSNQWGELRMGRDYTATFWNWTAFDPFGTNGVGSALNLALGQGLRTELQGGATYGTLVRANNMVAYILPAGQFGPGLYGQVQAAAGEGASGNKYWGGRIGYSAGPFNVAAAYGQTMELLAGTDIDADVWNVAGSWNFGFMKLSAFYGQIDVDGIPAVFSANGKAGRENWYVGVSAPFGQWNFKASYGGTNGNDAFSGDDATQWALGADYNLSKRTALYATWGSINNEGRSRFVVSTQSSNLSPGTNSTGGQVGVRHSF
jgi:predicted porin